MSQTNKRNLCYATRLLSSAVRNNNLQKVQYAIQRGGWISDHHLVNAIILCAKNEIIELLLKEKGNPNAISRIKGSRGESVLYLATCNQNLSAMKALLDAGACIDKIGLAGRTPLHAAISRNFFSGIKLLLAAGVNLYVETRNYQSPTDLYRSPLMLAIHECNIHIMEFLLQIGVNPNRCNSKGMTPLMYAVQLCGKPLICTQESLIDVMTCLLKSGADIDAVDSSGRTALHHACKNKYVSCGVECLDTVVQTVELLLNWGANVNAVSYQGENALMHLLHYQTSTDDIIKIGELLLNSGININEKNIFGDTALMIASGVECTCNISFIVFLIDAGASVNNQNIFGESVFTTLLTHVVVSNEILELLIYSGMQLNGIIENKPNLHEAWKLHQKLKIRLDYQCRELIRRKLFKFNNNCITQKVKTSCLPTLLKQYILKEPTTFYVSK